MHTTRRRFLRLASSGWARLALALPLVALCLLRTGAVTPAAADDNVTTVQVVSGPPSLFSPVTLTVQAGTKVRFTAVGRLPHTVTSDGCVDARAGACTFDSGSTSDKTLTASGTASFDFTFSTPGVYSYFCRIHGGPGGLAQSGTIVVAAANQAAPIIPAAMAPQLRPTASVAIYSPANGATITGDTVSVNLGVNGATLRRDSFPAPIDPKFGHVDLLLDASPDLTAQVATSAVGVSAATTNEVTLTDVKPGPHTLTAVWVYGNNVSPQPPITTTVKFTTIAGAGGGSAIVAPLPAVTGAATGAANVPTLIPPATGDGGLAASTGSRDGRLAGILGMALLATVALAAMRRARQPGS